VFDSRLSSTVRTRGTRAVTRASLLRFVPSGRRIRCTLSAFMGGLNLIELLVEHGGVIDGDPMPAI
jgi:hypothetical protein